MTARLHGDVESWVNFRVNGPHIPIGESGIETPAYSVLDVGSSIDLGSGRTLDVEVYNTLGIKFVELSSSGDVTPGAPRSASVQLRMDELPF